MYILIYMCIDIYKYIYMCVCVSVFLGPFHHGMARLQVAVGGTASNMEGSCE